MRKHLLDILFFIFSIIPFTQAQNWVKPYRDYVIFTEIEGDSIQDVWFKFDRYNQMDIKYTSKIKFNPENIPFDEDNLSFEAINTDGNLSDSLLYKKITMTNRTVTVEYLFYSPDQYAVLEHHNNGHSIYNYLWKEFSYKNIPFIVLYDQNSTDYDHINERIIMRTATIQGIIFQTKDNNYTFFPSGEGKYFVEEIHSGLEATSIDDFKFSNYHPLSNWMKDAVDTIQVNGKQGVQTYLGRTLLPPIYDSIHFSNQYILTYQPSNITVYDLQFNLLEDSLKAVYSLGNDYLQIITKENEMCYLHRDGTKREEYQYRRMSTGDIVNPSQLRILYSSSRKKPYAFCYAEFLPYGRKEPDYNTFTKEDIIEYSDYLMHLMEYNLRELIPFSYYKYKYHIWKIPKQYKDPTLLNGYDVQEYDPRYAYFIIATKKGKKGILYCKEDIKNPEVVPFMYDEIKKSAFCFRVKQKNQYGLLEGSYPFSVLLKPIYDNITPTYRFHLLEKDGLKVYYPLGTEPVYSELGDFINGNFASFEYPDGRKGWLDRSGKEFFNNKD